MSNLKKLIHITLLKSIIGVVVLVSTVAWPQAVFATGPDSGSGGGYINLETPHSFLPLIKSTTPRLIDLYNIPKDRLGGLEREYQNLTQLLESEGTKLPTYEEAATEVVIYKSFPTNLYFQHVERLIRSWNQPGKNSINMVYSLFNESIDRILWNFVDEDIPISSHFKPKLLNEHIKINTVANYIILDWTTLGLNLPTQTEVFISRLIWNQFSYLDKVGLIIHETLRNTQKYHKFKFNDEILQKATAIMLLCLPAEETGHVLVEGLMSKHLNTNITDISKQMDTVLNNCKTYFEK